MANNKINNPGNLEVISVLESMKPQGASKLIDDPKTIKAPINDKDEKKYTLTFQANESTRNALLNYCKDNDMTVTAGIKKAIREMLQRENVM